MSYRRFSGNLSTISRITVDGKVITLPRPHDPMPLNFMEIVRNLENRQRKTGCTISDSYTMICDLQYIFREFYRSQTGISIPSFYRKMRDRNELSNADSAMLVKVMEDVLGYALLNWVKIIEQKKGI